MRTRSLLWRREDAVGTEVAFVTLGAGRITATGSAIGSEPVPYRLTYAFETEAGYDTGRFTATAEGLGWRRVVDLSREGGRWSCDATSQGGSGLPDAGADVESLRGAADVDLGYSPLTNTPPVLRAGLLEAGPPVDVDAAWVSVPDLAVRPLEQRYTFVRRNDQGAVVRYETRSGSFTADLTLDADGFVVRYPGLATLAS